MLAVQAQDPRGARLAVRARSVGPTAADIDRALTVDRSLVVGWLNRGTLHLVAVEDYWWLHSLTTPQLRTSNVTRLRQEGVGEHATELGVDLVAGALRSGPQTREQLRAVLDAAGVPTAGQALVHVLFATSIRGFLVRGPMVGREQAFVDPVAWIGPPGEIGLRDSLARLARRYLVGHAPADARDLAKWAGITLGDARAGFDAIVDELEPWGDGLSRLSDEPEGVEMPSTRLLGSFDPILHGWRSRELLLGAHTSVVTVNGIFRPTLLVDGRVRATWTLDARAMRLRPLESLSKTVLAEVERECAAVQRHLGLAVTGTVVVDAK